MSQSPPESPAPLPEAMQPRSTTPPEAVPVHPWRHRPADPLPPSLGVLPLRDVVVYPGMVTPLVVVRPAGLQVIRRAASLGMPLIFVAQRNPEVPDPEREDLHDVGTLGRLLRVLRFSDGTMRILVQGSRRVRVGALNNQGPAPRVEITALDEIAVATPRAEALRRQVQEEFRAWNEVLGKTPVELDAVVGSMEDAARMADYVAGNMTLKLHEAQGLLEETDVERRLQRVRELLAREREMAELSASIHANVQVAMDKNQREYFLREQLRAVKEELGEYDPTVGEIETLRKNIEAAGMPEPVRVEALRELERMERMHKDGAEYTVARTWIDWLLDMPWKVRTEETGSLDDVEAALAEDHCGLEPVKERILEYLSVRQLNPEGKGAILCFLGPPGVGKTSLGRSIARALGRQFQRVSLGGIKDESEVRGHRRTYIGSMPGRIIQAMKRAGTMNPVIVLDEIDKVGNDFRGDPASALLEALDPEQNKEFTDHYLDVPFDLSQVMFLCTANVASTIPEPLLDRMEVIELPGYIEEEKLEIARTHLVPKQRKEHGLKGKQATFADPVLQTIIADYTSEAGVRGLEQQIARVCRKVARRVVQKKKGAGAVTLESLIDFLGPQKYFQDMAERVDLPGIAVGLAWTPVGGDILFIEATRMPGDRKFRITGQLGDVMKESAETALAWIRSNAELLGIDGEVFRTHDLHVHIPHGAIPKDGPSAGVTIIVSLVSLLTGRTVSHGIAMTGEITLRGKVLPVGGIKEKVLAARRAGIRKVMLPRRNAKDLLDIPATLRDEMEVVLIDRVEDVWRHVFEGG